MPIYFRNQTTNVENNKTINTSNQRKSYLNYSSKISDNLLAKLVLVGDSRSGELNKNINDLSL